MLLREISVMASCNHPCLVRYIITKHNYMLCQYSLHQRNINMACTRPLRYTRFAPLVSGYHPCLVRYIITIQVAVNKCMNYSMCQYSLPKRNINMACTRPLRYSRYAPMVSGNHLSSEEHYHYTEKGTQKGKYKNR